MKTSRETKRQANVVGDQFRQEVIKKRDYIRVTDEKRELLASLVLRYQAKISHAAFHLDIKQSVAKFIVKQFKT